MNIIFFGSPNSAIPSLNKILEAGHNIKLIITQPDKPSGRGKKLKPCPVKKIAKELNIPTYQPIKIRKDSLTLDKIKKIQPDLNVVVAYGQIIPSEIIYLPKHNSLNVHFSLLPKYRGASPVQWALLNGEEKTGITIFELNEKMDEGDILVKEEVKISPDENTEELETRLAQKGAELLIKTIAQIDKIKPYKQDPSQASYAVKLSKENGQIDWTKNANYIERQVKAFTPWPSAYTFFNNKRIKIHKGRKKENQAKPCSLPGMILEINKEGIKVCCGDGSIYLIEILQPENKKQMFAYAYSLGAKLKPGETFS